MEKLAQQRVLFFIVLNQSIAVFAFASSVQRLVTLTTLERLNQASGSAARCVYATTGTSVKVFRDSLSLKV